MAKVPKVFISYSHDSPNHSDRVWELCERLRQDGVNCCIDQHEASPPEGWPRWCRNQVQVSDFVLVVCTEAYCRRYQGKESPGKGLGVNWEGFVITQELYDAQGKNAKFVPIVFSKDGVGHIPSELRAATHYDLSAEEGYENLFRRLTDQPARERSEVGPLREMPPQAPFDRRDLKGPIWTVPIPPNPLFTGRAQTLTDIDVSFSSTRKAALVGLGGVGKTQAAARYAYLRRDNYDAVLWVAAASRETLVSDFVALGARLGMPQMGAEETIAAVKRWLETREKWLLVLDNADDLSVLGEFVPAASPGHVLVTTQAQATGTVATTIEISEMKPEEGGYFILRRGKLISEETAPQEVPIALREVAETVSGELGGLPLALDQAGAFIEESACGLSTYLELYRERRARLLRRRGNLATAHPDSVVATFTLSFEKIVQANPAAADVLRLCAFLSPDAISEEIFTTACTGLGADLEGMAGDAFQFNEAVAQILKYSLVRRDSTRKTITIHRLVQAVLQDGMTAEERRQWADRAVRAVNCNFPKSEFGSRAVCERLIRHAEVCGKLIREYALDFQEGARLLNQAGAYLLERARFKEAEDLLERAAKLAGSTSELRPTFLPVVLNNLAAVYHAIGKYDMAERANKQVLGARERHLGPDHPEVAQSLNNLGTVYMVEGKYKEAKAVLKRALAIKEKSLNPKDPELATTLNNLGGLHEALAEYSEAESAYRRALEIRREVLARISHQLLGTGFNGAGRGDCGLTLSRQRRKSACG